MSIAASLRRARLNSGSSLRQVAAASGVGASSLSNIESGRQNILLHHVYALAAALGFTKVAELLPPLPQKYLGEELKMTLSNQGLSKQTLSEHAEAQVADLITSALAPRRGLKAGS